MAIEDYFSVNIFFIIFRETLECVIIVSVLLAYLKQNLAKDDSVNDASVYRKLRLQVWTGALCGIIVCLLIGGIFILAFYLIDIDLWSKSEHYWEGVFSILASIIISIMGFGMLQLNKLEKKWHVKLSKVFNEIELSEVNQAGSSTSNFRGQFERLKSTVKQYSAKNSLFILPFVTTLRECLESIVFIGGIGLAESSKTYLLSIILGIIVGSSVGLLLYKSGTSSVSAQSFLVYSTCFLYLISAGLLSKGVWQFELQKFIDLCGGLDVSEVGSGPGSYDVSNLIWHVNCCNGEIDGPWMIATAIFGWTNSATVGSVISYMAYWVLISTAFKFVRYENKHGYLPFIPLKWQLRRIKKTHALRVKLRDHDKSHRLSDALIGDLIVA